LHQFTFPNEFKGAIGPTSAGGVNRGRRRRNCRFGPRLSVGWSLKLIPCSKRFPWTR
ncbi:hypothetical protein LINPERPRIM_LOCUS15180, partial [Linum perenne]